MTQHTLSDLHTEATSGLSYRLRLPAPTAPTRLLVLLHGVGGNETNLLEIATGVDANTLVVLVRGPLALGPQQHAWFQVRFGAEGPKIVPEEAERSRTQLIALVAKLQSQYGITADKSVVAGFSQGGIMSAGVALTAPESVAGFGLLSGRILPELEPHIASKERLSKLRGFVGHGEYDSKLPLHWAQRSDVWLTELGVQHTLNIYPIDHGISAAMHADFIAWLKALVA